MMPPPMITMRACDGGWVGVMRGTSAACWFSSTVMDWARCECFRFGRSTGFRGGRRVASEGLSAHCAGPADMGGCGVRVQMDVSLPALSAGAASLLLCKVAPHRGASKVAVDPYRRLEESVGAATEPIKP